MFVVFVVSPSLQYYAPQTSMLQRQQNRLSSSMFGVFVVFCKPILAMFLQIINASRMLVVFCHIIANIVTKDV